ncbi:hypothetical protein VNO77_39065 [Canavalia gladiata]|uniref:Uncharacterized protein n=1 Tax=Canavalia gladiata TaxID=3824 RepID=A0AAN9PZE4_CANGL
MKGLRLIVTESRSVESKILQSQDISLAKAGTEVGVVKKPCYTMNIPTLAHQPSDPSHGTLVMSPASPATRQFQISAFLLAQSLTLESLAADSYALSMGRQGYTECDKILLLTLENDYNKKRAYIPVYLMRSRITPVLMGSGLNRSRKRRKKLMEPHFPIELKGADRTQDLQFKLQLIDQYKVLYDHQLNPFFASSVSVRGKEVAQTSTIPNPLQNRPQILEPSPLFCLLSLFYIDL